MDHNSKRTEFPAIATTYVGNFTGNCTIQLNGQAIVVVNRGVEINRWPYNCIRQFRAEDESGKFSFVSGRRGPYGVAEYNFKLLSDSLVDLQGVLTEFTGAQFSAVAPGSGTDQQQQQPPPPVYPPTMPRPSSSSSTNSYTTSFPRHMTMGMRTDSTSSDHYPDSVFNSPARGPKLPPRDYSMMTSGEMSTHLASSADEATLRGLNRARASTSSSTNSFGLDIGTYSSPRPALPPPRREAKEPSPEVLVAKSNSYEEAAHLASQQGTLGKGKGEKPAVPSKKRSLFNRGKKSSKNSEHVVDNTTEPSADTSKPHPPTETKLLANGKPHDKSHESVLDTLPEEDLKVRANRAKKESPYDHLPSEKESLDIPEVASADTSGTNPSSGATSPVESDDKQSPDLRDGCSDLDYIPRSSPRVQTRSITPEHAQHLRKLTEKEGPTRVSASLRGKRSPPDKLTKKSNTMAAINVNGAIKPAIPNEVKEDESLYNVSRPTTDDGLYKVPKSVMDSPPSPRGNISVDAQGINTSSDNLYSTPKSNGTSENMYSAPKPLDQTDPSDLSGIVPEDAMYKVPSSVLASEENGVAVDEASHYTQASGGESLYSVPRSMSNSMSSDMCDNAAYNDLQSALQGVDPLHSRPAQSPTSPSNLKNNYESIDVEDPRFNTLRAARSFESLNRLHVNQSETGDSRKMSAYTSTPTFTNKPTPKCEYVDIDLPARPPALAPAKNAPLPPLPSLAAPAGPDPIADGVYAEITEETIARGRQVNMASHSHHQPVEDPLYSEPRPVMARYPTNSMAQEGMAKAKELAEEEGYELFMPAMSNIGRPYTEAKSVDSVYPPTATASSLLQKYNINIQESGYRSRPFSESDLLDGSHDRTTKRVTSIADSEVQSDEYVIVTGSDRKPKFTASQNVASTNPAVEDEYEVMNSQLRLAGDESQYSTPNPSLWSGGVSSVPQPQLASGITRQSSAGRVPATTTSCATPPLPQRKYDMVEAGIDLEGMSPIDSNPAPLYSNFHYKLERQSSNLSSCSGRSEGEVDGSVSDKGPPSMPIAFESAMVKVMAGSPMDRSDSTDLKNRARSHGNVLDLSSPPSPPRTNLTATHSHPSSSTSPTASHTPSPSPPRHNSSGASLSPTNSKRHNYVNCTPKEGEEEEEDGPEARQRTASAPKGKKRPRPLPRSSVLLRGDSVH